MTLNPKPQPLIQVESVDKVLETATVSILDASECMAYSAICPLSSLDRRTRCPPAGSGMTGDIDAANVEETVVAACEVGGELTALNF